MGQGRQGIRRQGGLTALSEQIDEAYVRQAARLAGVDVDAEQLPRVLEHLRRTASLALLLEDFVLATEEEIAPTWRP